MPRGRQSGQDKPRVRGGRIITRVGRTPRWARRRGLEQTIRAEGLGSWVERAQRAWKGGGGQAATVRVQGQRPGPP